MESALATFRKNASANQEQESQAIMQDLINKNKKNLAALNTYTPGQTDNTAVKEAANQMASLDVNKATESAKKISVKPLAIEYNGKLISKSNTTINIQPENLDGMVQSKSDIALNCGFYLKNMTDTETISWKIETSGGTELLLQSPLLISAGTTDPYLGIKWPQDQDQLKLTATAGSRTLVLKLLKPAYTLSNLTAVDYNATARKATAGQTLYLVKAPLKAEKATIQWTSNIASPLLTQYFTVDGSTSPNPLTSNKILYTYSDSPSSTTYRMNAMDYDKTVKVQVVDLYKRDENHAPPFLTDIVNKFDGVESTLKKLKNKLGFNESVVPKIKFDYKNSEYNKAVTDSRLYEDVKEKSWSVGLEFKPKDDFLLPPPFSGGIPYIIQYGAFINTSITISAEYGEILKRKVETSTFKGSPIFKMKGSGDITAGAKISALTVSSSTEIEFKAYGKSGVYAQGAYNSGKVKIDAGISPLVFGISGKGKALGFEVFNFKKEWLLLDRTQMLLFESNIP